MDGRAPARKRSGGGSSPCCVAGPVQRELALGEWKGSFPQGGSCHRKVTEGREVAIVAGVFLQHGLVTGMLQTSINTEAAKQ